LCVIRCVSNEKNDNDDGDYIEHNLSIHVGQNETEV